MDYLLHRNKYIDPKTAPHPSLILLDLNIPRKDGREALKEIKADTATLQTNATVMARATRGIMRTPQDFDRPVEVSTTLVPLMDVVFAILTFFVMSTLYLTKSEGLIVNLPKATQSQSQQQ